MELKQNIEAVQEKIAAAEAKAGVAAGTVELIAVSKTVTSDVVAEAYRLGLRSFGENRVQEFLRKREALPAEDIRWNLIGQLQTNKVKYIIDNKVALLHSLDRLALAEELQKECVKKDTSVEALIEVNIAREESKSGMYLEDVDAFLEKAAAMDRIHLRGVMTVAPFTDDRALLRRIFAQARTLFEQKKKDFPGFAYLSMGMSNDYEDAILEGSNMVRVGTAVFGRRVYQ